MVNNHYTKDFLKLDSSQSRKPYSINVDKVSQIASLEEITLDSIKSVYKLSKSVEKLN